MKKPQTRRGEYKHLKCDTCTTIINNVDSDTVKVYCWKCVIRQTRPNAKFDND
jgi:hypothetical protein